MSYPTPDVLVGVDPATMTLWLQKAQLAYGNLMAGGQVESVSYAQADGSRSVTYTRANMGQLTQWIAMLQRALGLPVRGRRPIVPYFR